MKQFMILLILLGLCLGCSYGKEHVELMLENPGVFEDSLYTQYHQALEQLEKQYLNKEISYAEYVERKQELEDKYSYKATTRQQIIEGN